MTDGDIRRALLQHEQVDGLTVADLMTKDPIAIEADASLKEAVDKMEKPAVADRSIAGRG